MVYPVAYLVVLCELPMFYEATLRKILGEAAGSTLVKLILFSECAYVFG